MNTTLYTTKEAAKILKYNPGHVRRLAREGKIGYSNPAGSYRFSSKDIEDFLSKNRRVKK